MPNTRPSPAKRNFSSRAVEWIEVLFLAALGIFGLVASGVQFLEKDATWLEGNPAISVALLSVIAIHLAIDRTLLANRSNRRMGRVLDRLSTIEDRLRALAVRDEDGKEFLRATGHYIKVQRLRNYLSDRKQAGYATIAKELLHEPFTLLESLADGKLNIPEHQIPAAQAALGRVFGKSFEAVSDDDLDFWLDTQDAVAVGYLEQNVTAIDRDVPVTRIFITSLKAMGKRMDDLAAVLTRQHHLGIGWGVCLRDDFDADVKNMFAARTDFAIFDGGEVVTYFRKRSMRRFLAVFNTHGAPSGRRNDAEVDLQKKLHTSLVGECWIVSRKFSARYTSGEMVGQEVVSAVAARGSRHNELLREKYPDAGEIDAAPFLFVVDKVTDIQQKLTSMYELARLYREASSPPIAPAVPTPGA
jgi:hypothetical protein